MGKRAALRSNPTLLTAPNPAITYFARRDLLREAVPPVERLW
jgi:hypothetical protein